ncbi:MAG: hypothetical protein IPN34_12395 [Planctomycetes bacterium]|nr:hypothetical protein [Planctomycetota bacterium]
MASSSLAAFPRSRVRHLTGWIAVFCNGATACLWALRATWIPPLLVALCAGAFPGWRALTRRDDGERGERVVVGQGIELRWVRAGAGWPGRGANWHEARDLVARLAPAGDALLEQPVQLWRLPTRDEVVRSLSFRGANAGGVLDASGGRASYRVLPDKEAPLWDPTSEVIYWWTADELDGEHAWSVCYNGSLLPRRKSDRMGTLGFRAVRSAHADGAEIPANTRGAR